MRYFMMASALLSIALLVQPMIANSASGTVTYLDNAKSPTAPLSYFDSKSKVTFYVESDGRHVTALNSAGKILWHRDPYAEGKLEAYRVARPVIVWIGETHVGNQLGISFNSSQFGTLDPKTGNFKFMGQD